MEEEKQNRELTEDDFDDEFYNDENDSDYEYSDENKKDEPEESENAPEEKKDIEDTEDTDDILKASETEKGNPDKNNASFLNRNMLFITVGSIFIVFLFFCVFILPNITKRKVAQNNELDKAGKVINFKKN